MTQQLSLIHITDDLLRYIIQFCQTEEVVNLSSTCTTTRKINNIVVDWKTARELTARHGNWYERLTPSVQRLPYVPSNASFTRPDLLVNGRELQQIPYSNLLRIWATEHIHKRSADQLFNTNDVVEAKECFDQFNQQYFQYLRSARLLFKQFQKAEEIRIRLAAINYGTLQPPSNLSLETKVFYLDLKNSWPPFLFLKLEEVEFFLKDNPYALGTARLFWPNEHQLFRRHIAAYPQSIVCLRPNEIPPGVIEDLSNQRLADLSEEEQIVALSNVRAEQWNTIAQSNYEIRRLLRAGPFPFLIDPFSQAVINALLQRGGDEECKLLYLYVACVGHLDPHALLSAIEQRLRENETPTKIDRDVLLEMIRIRPTVCDLLPKSIFSDKTFVTECVSLDPNSIRFVGQQLLTSENFCLDLLKRTKNIDRHIVFSHFPEEMKRLSGLQNVLLENDLRNITQLPTDQILDTRFDSLCSSAEDWRLLDEELAYIRIGRVCNFVFQTVFMSCFRR